MKKIFLLFILTLFIGFNVVNAEEGYVYTTSYTFKSHYDAVKGDHKSQYVYVTDTSVFDVDLTIGELLANAQASGDKLAKLTITPTYDSTQLNLASVTAKQDGFQAEKIYDGSVEKYVISSTDSTKKLEPGVVATLTFEVKTYFTYNSNQSYDKVLYFSEVGETASEGGRKYYGRREYNSPDSDTTKSALYVNKLTRAIPTFQRSQSTISNTSVKLAYKLPDNAVFPDEHYTCNLYRTGRGIVKSQSCEPYVINYLEESDLTASTDYYYQIGMSSGSITDEFKVTTTSEGADPLSTTKGDWNNDNDFGITDITYYRKYLAGNEEAVANRNNKKYDEFDLNTKGLLNFDSDTTISLTDLIQARLELADKM